MNDHYKISHILVLLLILIVIIFALVSGLNTIFQPQPINIPPRASEPSDVHHLFFRAVEVDERDSSKATSLAQGKDFALLMMLSRATGLDEGKKYKFHLKFNYNANVFNLKKPYNSELNESERKNSDIIGNDSVFDEIVFDKIEEKETDTNIFKGTGFRLIDIEGNFSSTRYSSLDAQDVPEEKKDRLVIIGLLKFQVKSDVVFDDPERHLLEWDRDDTKIERVDSALGVGFINPNNELKLEMVDKYVKDFKTGVEVIPDAGSQIVPLGGVKTTPAVDVPGQTSQIPQTTGGVAMTLNLSLKFQGILSKPTAGLERMPVKVIIAGGSIASPVSQTQTADFIANDSGIWKGSVSFNNIAPGSGYRILVKGPQHSQKRICVDKPSEPSNAEGSYSCGDGKITLKQGVNDFDFTGIALLVGDLAPQDGVVNAYDSVLVRELIISQDPEKIKLADLNRNATVNAQDFALLVYSLQVKGDEQ